MTLTEADVTARIARRLTSAREAAGLSKNEAGRRLDPPVRHNEITRYERGKHRPGFDKLLQFATIYGVDYGYFFSPNGEDQAHEG